MSSKVSFVQQVTDVLLRNGGRLHLEAASRPEYATPECGSVPDLVVHDKAGERILEGLLSEAGARARRLRALASLPIVDVRRLARDERADFAAFLATLSPQQWQAPTLCGRWRVRDVVAHVISYDELAARGLLAHAGQSDGHHDTPAWLQWQFPIGRDHCGKVHAVTEGLDQAAVVRRESSHSASEAPRGTLRRRRIERDPSPEPVLPHRGHPSRPTRSVARWAGPATSTAGRPA